jgi:NAD(P)-dependent dehydrogenase (short-subunit alcohol dehydrogenase family)
MEIRRQFETLVLAPIRLARLALPSMRDRGEGRIVVVSSILGFMSTPVLGWYVAAKHALEAVTDVLRVEVAHDGIFITSVQPGPVDTPIYDRVRALLGERQEAGTRYGPAYDTWSRATKLLQPLFSSPEAVARRVVHAIESPRPKHHDIVGIDGKALAAAYTLTPPPVRDRVLRAIHRLG